MQDLMIMNVINLLQVIDWHIVRANGSKQRKPKFWWLPGLEPVTESMRYGSDPQPIEQVKARLALLDSRWASL